MTGLLWTDEEKKILKSLNEKGYPVQEICKVFKGRTEASIRSQMAKTGLRPNVPKPDLDMDLYKRMMEVEEV